MTTAEKAEKPPRKDSSAGQPAQGAPSGLARRYARALYDYALEQGKLPHILAEAEKLRQLIDDEVSLQTLLKDRRLDSGQAGKALTAVLEAGGFSETLRRFAAIVERNRRRAQLNEILEAFFRLDAQRRGETSVVVSSAHSLTKPQRAALQRCLTEAGYHLVALQEHVVPGLLGGLRVQIGSKLFDTSLRGRLIRLQNAMKGAA